MEKIIDQYMIPDLRNVVIGYIDNYRFQYDCCVWELHVRFENAYRRRLPLPLDKFYQTTCKGYLPYWLDSKHRKLCDEIQHLGRWKKLKEWTDFRDSIAAYVAKSESLKCLNVV
jgi:hypothetical protein